MVENDRGAFGRLPAGDGTAAQTGRVARDSEGGAIVGGKGAKMGKVSSDSRTRPPLRLPSPPLGTAREFSDKRAHSARNCAARARARARHQRRRLRRRLFHAADNNRPTSPSSILLPPRSNGSYHFS